MSDKSRYCASQDLVKGSKTRATREQLSTQCEKALEFPKTLIHDSTYPYSLNSYLDRLDKHEDRLFQDENHAALDFSDLDADACGISTYTSRHGMWTD